MHLRGPMNISQLAVYQVPNEASQMKKRSTVPFYNRRRALKHGGNVHDNVNNPQSLHKRTWTTTTSCSSVSTVTSTVTVTSCTSGLSSISTALSNTTYTGPILSCLATPDVTSTAMDISQTPVASLPSPNCTCQNPPVTQDLERHPKIVSRLSPDQSPSLTSDPVKIHKRAPDWDRVAYYTSAAPAEATGFSFLANLGDPRQSGTFD
jgi:hypothetical protein